MFVNGENLCINNYSASRINILSAVPRIFISQVDHDCRIDHTYVSVCSLAGRVVSEGARWSRGCDSQYFGYRESEIERSVYTASLLCLCHTRPLPPGHTSCKKYKCFNTDQTLRPNSSFRQVLLPFFLKIVHCIEIIVPQIFIF